MQATQRGARRVRIWDLPTRLFHWLLAACVVASYVSAKIGGNAMVWHLRLGYVVLALLLFRVLWGVVGGRWSRFSSFVRPPSALARYLRGRPLAGERFDIGHNPLGALSVLAMLVFLGAQVASGLVADDEIATTGPLVGLVSGATSLQLTSYHKAIGQWVLVGLVALHLLAIAWYLVRGRNLVAPMVGGDQLVEVEAPASVDSGATRTLAAVLLAVCGLAVAWLVSLGG